MRAAASGEVHAIAEFVIEGCLTPIAAAVRKHPAFEMTVALWTAPQSGVADSPHRSQLSTINPHHTQR